MQKALACASGEGAVPLELEMSWRIEDIGAEAVLGREVDVRLIRRITIARKVYNAYNSRSNYRDENNAPNWAEWASNNPDLNRLLMMAERNADG
jgi:hypothetical protein